MKKILIYFVAFLLILAPVESFARTRLLSPAPVYKGTITGLRISAVDGTAFIDNANASVTALADGNHTIEIYDSAGRMLKGVLKAAGTGETLGNELITGWTNSLTNPYETFTTSGKDVTSAVNSSDIGTSNTNNCFSSRKLYYIVINTTINSGFSSHYRAYSSNSIIISSGAGEKSSYYTAASNDNYLGVYQSTIGDWSATFTIKQVLTPSASGATIVSTKGGEVYNFTSKNSAFTYNASSYYVIIR